MDASQGKGAVKAMEIGSKGVQERRVLGRPQRDRILNCPRCNSANTKFCYYNNYSLSQPRYFCKACRRYWTEGGTLRNVPVGGGSRKSKRSSMSSSSSSSCNPSNCNPTWNVSSSKKVSISTTVDPPIAPDSFSQNPCFGFHDLALASNYLLPGGINHATQIPADKVFEPGQNRAPGFPHSAVEMGIPPFGLALGSNPSPTPHVPTTSHSIGPCVGGMLFPLDFSFEGGNGNMQKGEIDVKHVYGERELIEQDRLQVQGDQPHGFWGGFFGAGPW